MVLPSNPRLMNRVLDAVVHLREAKGSTARDVLDFLRQTSKSSARNLTMQVQRALKHAVNAGLLHHRSGRYKARFTLNPAPSKGTPNEGNDEKSVDSGRSTTFGAQSSARVNSDNRDENRTKHKKKRQDKKRKRSSSRQPRQKRRSRSKKRDNSSKETGETRKLKHKEKGEKDRSPRNKVPDNKMKADIESASTSSPNRKRSRAKPTDHECYSDLSDSSDNDETRYRDQHRRKKTPGRQECKFDGRRSKSRNRSPLRQQSQHQQMRHMLNDAKESIIDCDNCNQNKDEDLEPNSGSGSAL